MASIDAILDRILERNADCLSLRSGQVPVVRTGDRSVPVQKVESSAAQILALARELAPAEADADRIDRGEPCTFRYKEFEVRLTFDPTGPCLDVLPSPGRTSSALPAAPAGSGIELDGPMPIRASAPATRPAPARPADSSSQNQPAPAVWSEPQLVTRRTALIGVALLGVVVLGGIAWCSRPVRVPNVVMADPSGNPVSFDDMRRPREHLLVVFIMPNDQISRFAVDSIKSAYAKASSRISFMGLYYGTTADATRAREQMGAPFPFYATKDAKNPFALQELFKKAGASTFIGASMYGGTTLLLDADNKLVFKLEKEDVQKLPEKLDRLAE